MARSTFPDSMSSRRLTAVLRTVFSVAPGASRVRRSTSAGRKTISPMSVIPIVTGRFSFAGSKSFCWLMPLWIIARA